MGFRIDLSAPFLPSRVRYDHSLCARDPPVLPQIFPAHTHTFHVAKAWLVSAAHFVPKKTIGNSYGLTSKKKNNRKKEKLKSEQTKRTDDV